MSKSMTRVSGLNDTLKSDAVNFELSIHDTNDVDSMIRSADVEQVRRVHNSSDEVTCDKNMVDNRK